MSAYRHDRIILYELLQMFLLAPIFELNLALFFFYF